MAHRLYVLEPRELVDLLILLAQYRNHDNYDKTGVILFKIKTCSSSVAQ